MITGTVWAQVRVTVTILRLHSFVEYEKSHRDFIYCQLSDNSKFMYIAEGQSLRLPVSLTGCTLIMISG